MLLRLDGTAFYGTTIPTTLQIASCWELLQCLYVADENVATKWSTVVQFCVETIS